MKIRLFSLALLFLASGCAFEIDTAMEMDEQGEQGGSTWIEYQKKGIPGDQELLALQVVKSGGQRQKKGNLSAWMKEDDPPFAVVALDESSKGQEMTKRTLYRFEDESIIAYSYPEFVETAALVENKNNREKYAREVAMQAKERRLPLMPLLYESKYAYSPKYDGGCTVLVTEKNVQLKIIGSYNVNVCKVGE